MCISNIIAACIRIYSVIVISIMIANAQDSANCEAEEMYCRYAEVMSDGYTRYLCRFEDPNSFEYTYGTKYYSSNFEGSDDSVSGFNTEANCEHYWDEVEELVGGLVLILGVIIIIMSATMAPFELVIAGFSFKGYQEYKDFVPTFVNQQQNVSVVMTGNVGIPAAAAVPVAAPASQQMNVQLPPDAKPGSQLQVQAPNGQLVSVIIPAGAIPGSTIQVAY